MKKKQRNILIGVGVVATLLIIGLLFIAVGQTGKTTYFYDGELGLIKISEGINPVKQTIFTKTTAVLGDTLTLQATTLWSQGIKDSINVKSAVVQIRKGNDYIKVFDKTSSYGSSYTISFKPTEIGTYTVEDSVSMCSKTNVNDCTNSVIAGNSVTVTTPETACTKKPYFGSWTTKNSISGGNIQEREFYSVTSSCTFKLSSVEDRIVCNSGYVVSGTSSAIADYTGFQNCEATIIPPKTECSADVTETCSDKTVVTLQTCASGVLVQTGNTCSVVEIPEVTPGVNPPVNNQTGSETGDNTDSSDGTNDVKEQTFLEKYEPYFMYIGAGIVILLVLLIGYNFIRRK